MVEESEAEDSAETETEATYAAREAAKASEWAEDSQYSSIEVFDLFEGMPPLDSSSVFG